MAASSSGNNKSEDEIESNKAWIVANKYVNSVGKVASNFSSAIRAITTAELKYGSQRSKEARDTCQRYMLPWLKRSPSLKAVFYYAAESMYEEELDDEESLTLSKLLDVFCPGEVATIMGLVYLKKRLEKRIDKNEWERLSTLFQIQMELGALVGEKLPAIGSGTGMLIGGLRILGYSVIAAEDLDGFKAYRRKTNKEGELFDLKYEVEKWGCNHLHIASLLVQNLGYGLQAGLGLGLSTSWTDEKKASEWFMLLDDETQCWQVAVSWIEALHSLKEFPHFVPKDHELYLSPKEEEVLQKRAKAILAKGSTFNWTQRNRDDLTEELHIRLGLVFDSPEDEDENAVFEEIEKNEDYVDLSDGVVT